MEKVITLLYDIEEKANHILNRATEEKSKLYEELNTSMEEADAAINKETQKKLKILQEKFDKEIASDTKNLVETNQNQWNKTELHFIQNRTLIVEQIFNQVIGS